LYLDANIYLDYWENRSDNIRPLGEFAFSIIKRAISCEFVIVYSDVVVHELCNVLKISKSECYKRFFKSLDYAMKLEFIKNTDELIAKSKELSKSKDLPEADANHLLLATKAESILVSRDKHHLDFVSDFKIKKPEEL
jgi:predicted nucleic acid-binding protein